jgi:putative mRNA 3-end processing factor
VNDDRGALGLNVDDGALLLRALGLSLDPTHAVATAFVSHAHAAQGAKGSGLVLASPETIALAHATGGPIEGARPIGWEDAIEMPIGRGFGGKTARLSIAPAGHMLGAAQLVVDHPRGRLVYTGDWGDQVDAAYRAGVAVPCDEIVVTSTFALPIFRFDPLAQTLSAIVAWCAARAADKVAPIVLAHTPGPAQSIARALIAAGVAVAAHDDVVRGCAAYEMLGVSIGPLRPHAPEKYDAVLVLPPSARGKDYRPRAAIAYASGWALLDAAAEQKRADAAFALADRADSDALMTLVRASGARIVHATHGDAGVLAHMLRRQGLHAEAFDLPPIDGRGTS